MIHCAETLQHNIHPGDVGEDSFCPSGRDESILVIHSAESLQHNIHPREVGGGLFLTKW